MLWLVDFAEGVFWWAVSLILIAAFIVCAGGLIGAFFALAMHGWWVPAIFVFILLCIFITAVERMTEWL